MYGWVKETLNTTHTVPTQSSLRMSTDFIDVCGLLRKHILEIITAVRVSVATVKNHVHRNLTKAVFHLFKNTNKQVYKATKRWIIAENPNGGSTKLSS